ncbi:hypothetical protein HXX76_013330 [Chlamydomonas incerta]|uniref:Uncharacterized protein n=1 Tax=Chlamydomonas incerta TaxID=51695 RepID=A0A835SJ85_CHLIN|nr:hypothetical protein HXX76_013330 [Chlamydomonas incerta]|eukprot:KAG2425957.1 hypothetical protein HXX76_013330 [Chlamydomonas incerta]
MARYQPVLGLRCAQLKVWGRQPEQLAAAAFRQRLAALLDEEPGCGGAGADNGGRRMADCYMRRGCIELVVDLETADVEAEEGDGGVAAAGDVGAAAAAGAAPGPEQAAAQPQPHAADAGPGSSGSHRGARADLSTQAGADAVADLVVQSTAVPAPLDTDVRPAVGPAPPPSGTHALAAAVAAGNVPLRQAGGDADGSAGSVDLSAFRRPPAAASAPVQASSGAAPSAPRAAPRRGASGPPGTLTADHPLSLVRAQALGTSSCRPLPGGPAIQHVRPRVLTLPPPPPAAEASELPGAPPAPPASAPGGPRPIRLRVHVALPAELAAAATAVVGSAAAGSAAAGVPPGRLLAAWSISTAPPAPRGTAQAAGGQPSAEAAGAAAGSNAASGEAEAAEAAAPPPPPLELLLRCGGRYVPISVSPAPVDEDMLDMEAGEAAGLGAIAAAVSRNHTAPGGQEATAPLPQRLRESLPNAALSRAVLSTPSPAAPAAHHTTTTITAADTGAITSTPRLTLVAYDVVLLEPPPLARGVLLTDLRWRGQPAHVVPVLLLDDDATGRELGAVAALWNGPSRELDGLLYDMGAWMRFMGARRAGPGAAAADSGAAAEAAASPARPQPGAARDLVAAGGGAPAAAAAAAAVGGGGGGAAGPAYLPVLGASLLQFAHAHGLMALASQLQDHMRDCGYTAAFRPLLRGRSGPPMSRSALEPQLAATAPALRPSALPTPWRAQMLAAAASRTPPPRPAAQPAVPDAVAPVGAPAAASVARGSDGPAAALGAGSGADAAPAAGAAAADGEWGRRRLAAAQPQAEASAGGSGGDETTAVDAAPAQPPGWLAGGAWARTRLAVAGTLGWWRVPPAHEAAYQRFAQSRRSAADYIFRLVDLLGLLELLLRLALLLAASAPAPAAAWPPRSLAAPAGGAADVFTASTGTGTGSSDPSGSLGGAAWQLIAGGAGAGVGGSAALGTGAIATAAATVMAVSALPCAVTSAVWLLLPLSSWQRLSPRCRVCRHTCLAAAKLLLLLLLLLAPNSAAVFRHSYNGLHMLMEGVLLPACCLVPFRAAVLLAALNLPLHIAAGRAAAMADLAAAAPAAAGAAADWGPLLAPGAGVAQALVLTAASVVTTLVCHVHLRLAFQMELEREARARPTGLAVGKKGWETDIGVLHEAALVAAAAAASGPTPAAQPHDSGVSGSGPLAQQQSRNGE